MDFTPLIEFMNHITQQVAPGNAVCVYHRNAEVFRYSSGFADVEDQHPMSEDALLNIYSCSKPATVVAALQLVEQGLCRLDDPLHLYIPAYAQMQVMDEGILRPAKNPITLRHLFTMQAGMDYDINHPVLHVVRQKTDGQMDTLEVAKALAEKPLLFEPGTRWNYSLCHDVLAAVVEIVSGQRFQDYMRQNIFEPLGMERVYYHQTPQLRQKMAAQYQWEGGADDLVIAQSTGVQNGRGSLTKIGPENVFVFGPAYDSGGAGIVTSVREYAKLADALACYGIGATGNTILRPQTLELLRKNQLSSNALRYFDWPQLYGYGYGLGMKTRLTGSHRDMGWGGAGGATIFVDPDIELGVFYAHHMLNPQESYYQPLLRQAIYRCI